MRDFLPRFDSVLEIADVACLLIAAPLDARDADVETIAAPLIRAAQARDVAALLPGRATLAKTLGADGVHLDLRLASIPDATRTYRDARKSLAEDAIVGALCPPERHLAMELAELGADYIGFDLSAPETADLIAWWGEMMTVPSVAIVESPADAKTLAAAGADFIAIGPAVWQQSDPLETIQDFAASLAG